MDEKKLVPQGVYLACDKGALPTELTVVNHSEVYLFEEPVATTADMIPMVNIQPFGTCMVTGSACMPVPIMWEGFEDGVFIGEFNPLLEDSVLQCGIGGRIKIYYSLAEAQAACPVPGMSMLQMLGTGLLVVAAVGLVVLSGGAIIAAVGALAAATTVVGTAVAGVVLAAEVAGLYFGVKALADYSQDGDEEALFKEVALGYLFLGVGKAVEKGFRMWKAARAGDEAVEVLEEGARAGGEVVESADEVAEIVTRQQGVIDDVENGRQALSSNKRKGNYGEMKMDRHLESLTEINGNPASLTRISDGAVESLDQTIVRGIDGVYENATPPPRFVIAEAKYNTSRLGNTLDGPQMSDDWILGSERLERILPPDIADDIRFALEQGTGDAQRVLTHIDTSGNVVTSSIDATGAIVGAWP